MQEDIERRTVAISITATKLTGKALAKAFMAVGRKIKKEHDAAQTPHGRQSVKKLMNHGVSTNALPLDGDTRLFDRVARKYNVDYSFHKTGPNKYLLFFKAGQADAITAAFSDYTRLVMGKAQNKRPSILEQIKQFGERVRSQPHKQERQKEAVRDER